MYFEKIAIRGFGCLRTEVEFMPERLNLAVADNETGKSTLVAAILAVLYGLSEEETPNQIAGKKSTDDKSSPDIHFDPRPSRWQVLPWTHPEEFSVTMDFSTENDKWRIDRDFHNRTVKVINRDTGTDRTSEFFRGQGHYRIGEELTGLTCENFLKSFYLRQNELKDIRDAGGLTPHVQRVASAKQGGVTSEAAIERLENALQNYSLPGRPGIASVDETIKELRQEDDDIKKKLTELEGSKHQLLPTAERLSTIEADYEHAKQELDKNSKLQELSEVRELSDLITKQKSLRQEYEKMQAGAVELKEFRDFKGSKTENLVNLSARYSELQTSITQLKEKIKNKVTTPVESIKSKLEKFKNLVDVSRSDLQDFEAAMSLYRDRVEKQDTSARELKKQERHFASKGVDSDKYRKLKSIFSELKPEEKRFLDDYRTNHATQDGKFREAKARGEWLERERDMIDERKNRSSSIVRIMLVLSAVLIVGGGLLWFMNPTDWLGQILTGLGIVFGALSIIIRSVGSGGETDRLVEIEEELEAAVSSELAAKNTLNSMVQELAALSKKLGFSDGQKFLTLYTNFDRIQETIEPLVIAIQEYKSNATALKEAQLNLKPFFDLVNEPFPAMDHLFTKATDLIDKYRVYCDLSDSLKTKMDISHEYDEELERLSKQFEICEKEIDSILEAANIEKLDTVEDTVRIYRQRSEKHNRYKALVETEIPRFEKSLLSTEQLNSKKQRLERLKKEIGDTSALSQISESPEYYREKITDLVKKREQLEQERIHLQRDISLILDRYQSQREHLMRQAYEVERDLEQAEAYRLELNTALSTLQDISKEVYRTWAKSLSEAAAPLLKSLNPRYSDLLFNEDLSFTVTDRRHDKLISSDNLNKVLSSGSRDEVFLAARLAISSYLAEGMKESLPIILDEPLSSADDDKFLAGMRFFLEVLSKEHQIMIMSCHQERHRWLSVKEPDLYNDRVHEIDLNAMQHSNLL